MGSGGWTRRGVILRGAIGTSVTLPGCLRTTPAGNGGRRSGESSPENSPGANQNSTPPASGNDGSGNDGSGTDVSATDTPDANGPGTSETGEPATDGPVDRPVGTVLDFETETYETTGQVLDGGIGGDRASDLYATTMTSRAELDRFDRTALDDQTARFVAETAFPEEVLLVAQRHLPSITLELALAGARIESDGLAARVETDRFYLFDASTNATLVARLRFDGHPMPDWGTVTFVDRDGERTEVAISDQTENS